MTSALLRGLVPTVMLSPPGLTSEAHSGQEAAPIQSSGSPALPRPRFTHPMDSGAGFSDLLAIAYDYDVLGLGPDSP